MKSIWIINQYLCTPELNGSEHRHSSLAEEFLKKNYDVTLITSTFSHVPYRHNKVKGLFKLEEGRIRTLLVKGNKYNSTQGLSRVISWIYFCVLLFFIPTRKIPKPDIIIVSSNSLLPILNVVFYFKKRFKKVKFILEIRDIWPLTLTELGGFSPQNIMIKMLAWVEKKGYKKADYIVSLLKNTDLHIKSILKSHNFKYCWVPNGYQLQKNEYYKELPKEILNKIPKEKFVVGYAGSLGKANAMQYTIEAFNSIKDQEAVLCLLGSGDEKENLKALAKKSRNIIFLDSVKKNQVQSFLKRCDLLYLGIRNLKLYHFGVSMNKTYDYMYAKKPILLSSSVKGHDIEIANCGLVIQPENAKAINKGIEYFKDLGLEEREKMGKRGREYLLENFTYDKLAKKYIAIFKKLS